MRFLENRSVSLICDHPNAIMTIMLLMRFCRTVGDLESKQILLRHNSCPQHVSVRGSSYSTHPLLRSLPPVLSMFLWEVLPIPLIHCSGDFPLPSALLKFCYFTLFYNFSTISIDFLLLSIIACVTLIIYLIFNTYTLVCSQGILT